MKDFECKQKSYKGLDIIYDNSGYLLKQSSGDCIEIGRTWSDAKDYRGGIERGVGGSYEWRDGYSANSADGLPLYPWMTRRECQHEAAKNGGIAVFYNQGGYTR